MSERTLTDLTPSELQCGIAGCPRIFRDDASGKFLVVGKMLDPKDLPAELRSIVGDGEALVEVPKNLFSRLND